ncbi:DUF1345 domain-containing protein [Dictyobacter aurantiacus]|uniref:DUF1345 domain-containing protein n=1 Tax=Dictyobacter aurantiacus TaxID=1936993 RepID=A0A401Z9M8_9CHLR|nr:DUF1345 domain-containing protein [Dictyobacter aurantiacus]GCE03555.1 hypothetical protein KDAU_08840 [Dictyobacter aurantiacus]
MAQIRKLPPVAPRLREAQPAEVAPLWVSTIAALIAGILYAILPEPLTLGPSWLPLVLELVIILPGTAAALLGHPFSARTNRILAFCLLGITTAALVIGVVLLVTTLPARHEGRDAISLLRTGALLWIANVLVFGLWYWEIDGSGPHKRAAIGHQATDFLFPQQADGNTRNWTPHFLDYLFLGFTGATALSPADTFPLSRRAKSLMMAEALIAMVILTILIGRAINIV